jgi:hypothetical protein
MVAFAGSAPAGAGTGPPSQALIEAANSAAKPRQVDGFGHRPPHASVTAEVNSSAFGWRDFGIGAGATLGLVLLALGLAAGAHYTRARQTASRGKTSNSKEV